MSIKLKIGVGVAALFVVAANTVTVVAQFDQHSSTVETSFDVRPW